MTVSNEKGYYGVSYRTLIGLHRTALSNDDLYLGAADDPRWEVYVGPLPFLLASSTQNPYIRESTPSRRERLDQAREPGENSLDGNVWLRSQTSWHLGAGQRYSEPLEEDPEIARFRFYRSGGLDCWTPGELSLLPSTASRYSGARHCLGVPGRGVLVSSNAAGVRLFPPTGSSTQLSTKTVTKFTANTDRWFAMSSSGLEWGDLSGAAGEGAQALPNISAIHWGKDRLLVADGSEFHEVTADPPIVNAADHTFSSGSIVDIDSGAGGIYLLVNDAFTAIYRVNVEDDGTLGVPVEMGTLPRGETGHFLYGYLGRYLVIGTSRGVRIADCGSKTDLPIGPLIVETTGGALDATGGGDYIWVTAGSEGILPTADGTPTSGLYRINLGSIIATTSAYGDTAAARFAYASDLYAADTSGLTYSVTTYEDEIYFVAGVDPASSTLFQEQADLVGQGWLEGGQVSYSTAERKTWLSFSLEALGSGFARLYADTGLGFYAVTQSAIATPYRGDQDVDVAVHQASGWLRMRLELLSDGSGGEPTVQSIGLRATPAPKRTRYIRMPLLCMDQQFDRNNNPIGYQGFAYDRVRDLEEVENRGGLISVVDRRTGETIRCQIDKVSFQSVTPPDKAADNYGGILTLTLLTV